MVEWELRDGIAVLEVVNPPVNALDGNVLGSFAAALDEIDRSDAIALIVSGRGEAFSAGADLFRILAESPEYLARSQVKLSESFGRLFMFPRPVVAAVNGHAIAGGCVISCAADHVVAVDTEDVRIGLAELKVGVPFPAWALEIARYRVAPQFLEEALYFGRLYGPAEAMRRGFINEVVTPGALMDRAFEVARRLAGIPKETFRLTKEAVRWPVAERARTHGAAHDDEVREAWASDQVRASMQSFLDRTFGHASEPAD
ncbi:MAG: enoyl-CoA hydratase/isomerase family protein [Actinomycetota bacterium]